MPYIDTSRYPFVVSRLPSGFDGSQLDAFFDEIQVFLNGQPPDAKWASIVDTTSLSRIPNASQRQLIAERGNQQDKIIGSRVVTTCLIVTNPVMRTLATGIFWLMPSDQPRHTAATLDDAIACCREELVKAGVSV